MSPRKVLEHVLSRGVMGGGTTTHWQKPGTWTTWTESLQPQLDEQGWGVLSKFNTLILTQQQSWSWCWGGGVGGDRMKDDRGIICFLEGRSPHVCSYSWAAGRLRTCQRFVPSQLTARSKNASGFLWNNVLFFCFVFVVFCLCVCLFLFVCFASIRF